MAGGQKSGEEVPEMRCKHASTGCTCLEMIICTAAIAGEPVEEMFCYEPICYWELYQADQSFENMTRWLKHRAWMKWEGCEC